MISIEKFEFNPFAENTYILFDETKECVIIDPGCYDATEQQLLSQYIEYEKLKPKFLLNTHCHIDHIFGNNYIKQKFDIPFYAHEMDMPVLESGHRTAMLYQLSYDESPKPDAFLDVSKKISFGNSELSMLFTPGHSPGSVCFVATEQKFIIGGDVLFRQSIGRTDLPGGNHKTLIESIKNQLYTLPDEFVVYPGHGQSTTIGFEKQYNPFTR
ncbi:MAG: MBL fold metallo-hydrolase [Flavobacteriales bacterium]|nr:MBL fold metallo-hydrolase [Flavobacteriales bacterium]